VYLLCILGFSVTLHGLYYGAPFFSTSGETFLTLFSGTLSNVNPSDLVGPNMEINSVGSVVYVVFIGLTAIVLLNLVIAIMSNTYMGIQRRAVQEWSFVKVCICVACVA
jgi:Ion transport protein